MGGKYRLSKKIATFLESNRKEGQPYLEPFVGSGAVMERMSGIRYGSDYNQSLITLFQNIQQGWVPPVELSESEYQEIKKINDPNDPLTAFAGFGCSFGGKWFGGYARSKDGKDYIKIAHRSLMRQKESFLSVDFSHKSYLELKPEGMLVYCDPPYQETTSFNGVEEIFDHDLFWETMRAWSENNKVIISEYKAPNDFVCVKEFGAYNSLRNNTKNYSRVEKLFTLSG